MPKGIFGRPTTITDDEAAITTGFTPQEQALLSEASLIMTDESKQNEFKTNVIAQGLSFAKEFLTNIEQNIRTKAALHRIARTSTPNVGDLKTSIDRLAKYQMLLNPLIREMEINAAPVSRAALNASTVATHSSFDTVQQDYVKKAVLKAALARASTASQQILESFPGLYNTESGVPPSLGDDFCPSPSAGGGSSRVGFGGSRRRRRKKSLKKRRKSKSRRHRSRRR